MYKGPVGAVVHYDNELNMANAFLGKKQYLKAAEHYSRAIDEIERQCQERKIVLARIHIKELKKLYYYAWIKWAESVSALSSEPEHAQEFIDSLVPGEKSGLEKFKEVVADLAAATQQFDEIFLLVGNSLGMLYIKCGRLKEAENVYTRGLNYLSQFEQEEFVERNKLLAYQLENIYGLGLVLRCQRDAKKAVAVLESASTKYFETIKELSVDNQNSKEKKTKENGKKEEEDRKLKEIQNIKRQLARILTKQLQCYIEIFNNKRINNENNNNTQEDMAVCSQQLRELVENMKGGDAKILTGALRFLKFAYEQHHRSGTINALIACLTMIDSSVELKKNKSLLVQCCLIGTIVFLQTEKPNVSLAKKYLMLAEKYRCEDKEHQQSSLDNITLQIQLLNLIIKHHEQDLTGALTNFHDLQAQFFVLSTKDENFYLMLTDLLPLFPPLETEPFKSQHDAISKESESDIAMKEEEKKEDDSIEDLTNRFGMLLKDEKMAEASSSTVAQSEADPEEGKKLSFMVMQSKDYELVAGTKSSNIVAGATSSPRNQTLSKTNRF